MCELQLVLAPFWHARVDAAMNYGHQRYIVWRDMRSKLFGKNFNLDIVSKLIAPVIMRGAKYVVCKRFRLMRALVGSDFDSVASAKFCGPNENAGREKKIELKFCAGQVNMLMDRYRQSVMMPPDELDKRMNIWETLQATSIISAFFTSMPDLSAISKRPIRIFVCFLIALVWYRFVITCVEYNAYLRPKYTQYAFEVLETRRGLIVEDGVVSGGGG